jgi:hypothetical protein
MSSKLRFGRRGGSADCRRSPITDSLITSVLGAEYATPRKVRPKKVQGRPNCKGADALVLEVRRLSEQLGLSPAQIRVQLQGDGHDLAVSRIFNLINYTTRSHLVPAPGAKPYTMKAEI